MTCESEYSLLCLSNRREHHWFWILLPIVLLIICLFYIFCRPDYTRLSSYTYERIYPTKSNIRLESPRQRNCGFNQHTKCPIPKSSLSSRFISEQYDQRTNENNNDLLHSDERMSKMTNTNQPDIYNTSNSLNPSSINNSNKKAFGFDPNQWNELRTPVLTNYPDLINITQARQVNSVLNLQMKNRPLVSNDILSLINRGFNEADPMSNKWNLGRIWFFLEYNPYLRQLYLTIIQARNLRSIKNYEPTTFVKAEILPEMNSTFSTDIVKDSANPDYLTEIIFEIDLSEFAHNVLKLTVHEVDKNSFHTPIGAVYYPLDHLLIAQRAKSHAIWRNLLPEYGDPSAIGLIQIRATIWYDADNECLNVYVHSLRATGIVKQVYQVYVHASVSIHAFPVIPEDHIESSSITKTPLMRGKHGHIVSLEQQNETIYDQLFRFLVYKHEFNDMTVVIDVYNRTIGNEFTDDVLLGRTILVSSEMLAKNMEEQIPTATALSEETKPIENF